MKRTLLLAGGFGAVIASYMLVIFGLSPEPGAGPDTLATIALPALVSGLVMTAFIAFDRRRMRETKGVVSELNAQLARKEIEIGRLSSVDELTGLSTRHHFDENLQLEFERSQRHGRSCALLLIEIDDLAELGEHIGAMSKGYILSEVGGVLRRMLRINDLGCRYAPDRLAALLPETNAAQARSVANKIRAMVAEHEFGGKRADGGFQLTVSHGIAVAPGTSISSHKDLLRAAEGALAEAKLAGFDKVRIAGWGEKEPTPLRKTARSPKKRKAS